MRQDLLKPLSLAIVLVATASALILCAAPSVDAETYDGTIDLYGYKITMGLIEPNQVSTVEWDFGDGSEHITVTITTDNPVGKVQHTYAEGWFVGHLGDFLFEEELAGFIAHLESTGLSEGTSLRSKCIHAVQCCRVLNKDMEICSLDMVGCECLSHLDGLVEDLNVKVSRRIMYDFCEFVEFATGKNPQKIREGESNRVPYMDTDEWREFMDLADVFENDLTERGLRPSSIRGMVSAVRRGYRILIEQFGPIRVEDIDYHHIRYLRNNVAGVKQRTLKRYLQNLGKMLEFSFGRNPYRVAGLLWSKESIDRSWIFKAQWKELWVSADVTERLVLALMGGMGLRRAEVTTIKLADINGNKMIVHGKGHGTRGKDVEKEIPSTVSSCIEAYLAVRESIITEYGDRSDDNLLVMSNIRKGTPISLRAVETIIRRLSERVKVRLSCHTLRRFYCMALIDAGVDIDTVRRMMRHDCATTTYECYIYADPRKMAAATATVESSIFG